MNPVFVYPPPPVNAFPTSPVWTLVWLAIWFVGGGSVEIDTMDGARLD